MAADPASSITAWAVFSALGGSVVGSLLGGVISYCLQKKNLAAAKAQRTEDRFEARKALIYSLLLKMLKISSSLKQLKDSIEGSLEKAKADGVKGSFWQIVMPLGYLPDRIKFSYEELTVLLSFDRKLFNDMGLYDDIHNSVVTIFELYRTKRDALLSTFPADMRGNIGTTTFNQEEMKRIAPKAAELDGLGTDMLQRTERDSAEALQFLQRLHQLAKKEFDLEFDLMPKTKTAN